MALALQPSPQTLSPRPPTAHRSPQRAEPTLMGLTPRQGHAQRRLRRPHIPRSHCLQSGRDQRCQDSRRHFPFVAHAATTGRLLLRALASEKEKPDLGSQHPASRPEVRESGSRRQRDVVQNVIASRASALASRVVLYRASRSRAVARQESIGLALTCTSLVPKAAASCVYVIDAIATT